MITKEQRDELRRLLAESTPLKRPWAYKIADFGYHTITSPTAQLQVCDALPQVEAALIAAAVNALPGLLDEIERLEGPAVRVIDIVFAGPPGPGNECVFVEVENEDGESLVVGEWVTRPDGFVALRLKAEVSTPCGLAAAIQGET